MTVWLDARRSAFALVVAAAICATGARAGGQAIVPLPAPPPPGSPVASAILDAMLAIERAAASNPAAAQRAAFSYNAAIQQYNAHQYARARASALTAISESGAPPAPAQRSQPALISPPAPVPGYYIIPGDIEANQPNAKRYVGLAQRAMAACGTAVPSAVSSEYRAAVAALDAKQYRVAMAQSRNVVDDCAKAIPRS